MSSLTNSVLARLFLLKEGCVLPGVPWNPFGSCHPSGLALQPPLDFGSPPHHNILSISSFFGLFGLVRLGIVGFCCLQARTLILQRRKKRVMKRTFWKAPPNLNQAGTKHLFFLNKIRNLWHEILRYLYLRSRKRKMCSTIFIQQVEPVSLFQISVLWSHVQRPFPQGWLGGHWVLFFLFLVSRDNRDRVVFIESKQW